jgi:hypothetical protein
MVILMMNKSYSQPDPHSTPIQKILDEYNELALKGYSEEEKKDFYKQQEEFKYQHSQVFKQVNWNELSDEQKVLFLKTSKIGHLQRVAARDKIPSYLPDSFKVTASEELMSIADKLSPLIDIMESKRQKDVDKLIDGCADESVDEVSFFLQSGLLDNKIYYVEVYDSLYDLASKSEKQALETLDIQIDSVRMVDIDMLKVFPNVMKSEIYRHCYKDHHKIKEFFKIKNEEARAAAGNGVIAVPIRVKQE